jgi:asparagine synthase (glutamine-hydrolysing)
MSGGLDSTSIAAIAVHMAKEKGWNLDLRAFTADHRPLFDDGETALTSLAAQHIGIPLEIVSGASCVPYDGWNGPLAYMPEPLHDPHQALQVEKFKLVAKHSQIALNGYGGDGIMTGQSWPYLAWLLQRVRFGRVIGDFGGYMLRRRRFPPLRAGLRSILRKCFKRDAPTDPNPRWLTPQFQNELRSSEKPREPSKQKNAKHPWHPIGYDMLNGGWAWTLEPEDSGCTGIPVESRAPLLDRRLQQFLLRVPPVPLCVCKEILRRTMRGLLPEEVRLRPKTGFIGDLMDLHMAGGQWKPLPMPQPNNGIDRFVDWQKLEAHLKTAQGSLWTNLRPISLLYWLKATNVEMSFGGATHEADVKHRFEKTV